MSRIKTIFPLIATLLLAPWPAFAIEIKGVVPENRIGGRMMSAGYMRGKVVLVDYRDYLDRSNVETLKRLQTVWSSFKTKPFVLIGCHTGESKPKRIAAIMDKIGVTFPVYSNVEILSDSGPLKKSQTMVIDPTFKRVVYRGEHDRDATGVVASMIMSLKMPSSAVQRKAYIDYDIEHLPGHAVIRLKELLSSKEWTDQMESKFPGSVETYKAKLDELLDDSEIKKLAKLVAAAESAKDRDYSGDSSRNISSSTMEDFASKYAELAESENPKISQEAKNSIADLKFAAAALKAARKSK